MLTPINRSINLVSIGSAFKIKDYEGTPKISIYECWSRWEYQMLIKRLPIFKLIVFKMLRRVLLANNWRHAGTEPFISVETTFTLQIIKNNALKVSNLCLSDPKFKPIWTYNETSTDFCNNPMTVSWVFLILTKLRKE